jgi:hypothetical protein
MFLGSLTKKFTTHFLIDIGSKMQPICKDASNFFVSELQKYIFTFKPTGKS